MKAITFFTCLSILTLSTSFAQVYSNYSNTGEVYYEDNSGQNYSNQQYGNYNQQQQYQNQPMNYQNQQSQQFTGNGNTVMHEVVSPKEGMVTSRIPLPADWKITPQGIMGPGGTKAVELGGEPLNGRNIYNIDQLVNGYLIPTMQQQGGQILGVIDLPAVARNDQRLFAQYWKTAPTQDFHAARGIEMKDNEGNPAMVVVHFFLSRSQFGNNSFYYAQVVSSSPPQYKQAKNDYLYGLANMQHDPQYLALYNQREQQKSNQSWALHNQRMNQNQINFNNSQKPYQNGNDVSDIIHEGWKKRNDMNNAGHDKTINGIHEQQTMTDPYTGQPVNVQSGYNNYYMNNNGEYIGTDDYFYNPNTDPNMNNQDWQQLQNNDDRY